MAVGHASCLYCSFDSFALACALTPRFALLATDRGAARSILVFKHDEDKVWGRLGQSDALSPICRRLMPGSFRE